MNRFLFDSFDEEEDEEEKKEKYLKKLKLELIEEKESKNKKIEMKIIEEIPDKEEEEKQKEMINNFDLFIFVITKNEEKTVKFAENCFEKMKKMFGFKSFPSILVSNKSDLPNSENYVKNSFLDGFPFISCSALSGLNVKNIFNFSLMFYSQFSENTFPLSFFQQKTFPSTKEESCSPENLEKNEIVNPKSSPKTENQTQNNPIQKESSSSHQIKPQTSPTKQESSLESSTTKKEEIRVETSSKQEIKTDSLPKIETSSPEKETSSHNAEKDSPKIKDAIHNSPLLIENLSLEISSKKEFSPHTTSSTKEEEISHKIKTKFPILETKEYKTVIVPSQKRQLLMNLSKMGTLSKLKIPKQTNN